MDNVICTDESMYNALQTIDFNMNNKNGAYSNALRKYYTFKMGKYIPRIAKFNSGVGERYSNCI